MKIPKYTCVSSLMLHVTYSYRGVTRPDGIYNHPGRFQVHCGCGNLIGCLRFGVHWRHSGPFTDIQATRPIPSNRGYHISKSLCLRSQLPSKAQGHGWGLAITPRVWYYRLQRPLEHLRRFLRHTITIWRMCCQEVLNCPVTQAWVCPCCEPPNFTWADLI